MKRMNPRGSTSWSLTDGGKGSAERLVWFLLSMQARNPIPSIYLIGRRDRTATKVVSAGKSPIMCKWQHQNLEEPIHCWDTYWIWYCGITLFHCVFIGFIRSIVSTCQLVRSRFNIHHGGEEIITLPDHYSTCAQQMSSCAIFSAFASKNCVEVEGPGLVQATSSFKIGWAYSCFFDIISRGSTAVSV